MKHLYFAFICFVSASLLLTGCSKNEEETDNGSNQTHTPGNIPGLGEKGGEPTGTLFKLPDNITFVGKILGGFDPTASVRSQTNMTKTRSSLSLSALTKANSGFKISETVGSGSYVTLYIILKNGSSSSVEVLFPAGLIAKSLSGNAQNGVLLKKTTIQIAANSTKAIMLMMYCGNANRDASSMDEEYQFAVVSNSSLIMDLCEKLKNKRINYEEYDMKSLEEIMSDPNFDWENFDWESFFTSRYNEYSSLIQDLLWKLTDYGEALSSEDISRISDMENSK